MYNSPLKLCCKVTFINDCFILRSAVLLLEKKIYTELLHANLPWFAKSRSLLCGVKISQVPLSLGQTLGTS